MLSLEYVAVLGYLFGPILRTVYDYGLKWMEDPDIEFNTRYLVTMLVSAVTGIIVAFMYLPGFLQSLPEGSALFIFVSAATQSFTLNHLINRPLESRFKREAEEVEGD